MVRTRLRVSGDRFAQCRKVALRMGQMAYSLALALGPARVAHTARKRSAPRPRLRLREAVVDMEIVTPERWKYSKLVNT